MNERFRHLLHLAVNALGLPGAGTWMAGRRVQGGIQIALSLALMAGTLLGLARLVHLFWTRSSSPQAPDVPFASWGIWLLETPEAIKALAFALACCVLYLANLAWSLVTARPLRTSPPPLPPSDS
jgi:hypothetical protein